MAENEFEFDKEFEKLRKQKIEEKQHKHINEEWDYEDCKAHLLEEISELKEAVDTKSPQEIALELADVANLCEIVFCVLPLRSTGKTKQGVSE